MCGRAPGHLQTDADHSPGRGQPPTACAESGSPAQPDPLYRNHFYRQVINPITDSISSVLHLSEKSRVSDFDVVYLNLSKIVLFFK